MGASPWNHPTIIFAWEHEIIFCQDNAYANIVCNEWPTGCCNKFINVAVRGVANPVSTISSGLIDGHHMRCASNCNNRPIDRSPHRSGDCITQDLNLQSNDTQYRKI